MLQSTRDYLDALRNGNYLLFLEWPRFVIAHYNPAGSEQTAEELIELLVFEWLSHGYNEDDGRLVALLPKIQEHETNVLSADLDCSAVNIIVALLQCMIYCNTHLFAQCDPQQLKNKKDVTQWMRANSIEPSLFDRRLQEQQATFTQWVDAVTDSQVTHTIKKMEPVLKLRGAINHYLDFLKALSVDTEDILRDSRINVAEQLAWYVQNQTELTDTVQLRVTSDIEKIRDLAPRKSEEEYINNIAPLSLSGKTLRLAIGAGIMLFDWVAPRADAAQDPLVVERSTSQPP